MGFWVTLFERTVSWLEPNLDRACKWNQVKLSFPNEIVNFYAPLYLFCSKIVVTTLFWTSQAPYLESKTQISFPGFTFAHKTAPKLPAFKFKHLKCKIKCDRNCLQSLTFQKYVRHHFSTSLSGGWVDQHVTAIKKKNGAASSCAGNTLAARRPRLNTPSFCFNSGEECARAR